MASPRSVAQNGVESRSHHGQAVSSDDTAEFTNLTLDGLVSQTRPERSTGEWRRPARLSFCYSSPHSRSSSVRQWLHFTHSGGGGGGGFDWTKPAGTRRTVGNRAGTALTGAVRTGLERTGRHTMAPDSAAAPPTQRYHGRPPVTKGGSSLGEARTRYSVQQGRGRVLIRTRRWAERSGTSPRTNRRLVRKRANTVCKIFFYGESNLRFTTNRRLVLRV